MKNNIQRIMVFFSIMPVAVDGSPATYVAKKLNVGIICGSTRKGRTSDKICNEVKALADKRTDVIAQIIDLRDFNLPFLNDEVPPASRKIITDPIVQKWADKINECDAFIIVSPEYNSGYPGVLKNALDSLYKEWNNKPVAFVVYSGGPSGGSSVLGQLRQVAKGLAMIPIVQDIKIAESWKAFDTKGKLSHVKFEDEFNIMVDQLAQAVK